MKKIESDNGRLSVEVFGLDEFRVCYSGMCERANRSRLEQIRSIFDQALNTSAEELGDE